MGADSSKERDITIERVDDDDGDIGVLKVTDSVLKRLTGQPELEDTTPGTEFRDSESLTKETQDYIGKLEKELDTCYSEFDDAATKLKEGQEEADKMAVEMFDLVKEKLPNIEAYVNMKESDKRLQEVLTKPISKAKVASPVCQELEEKVLQCYRDNPNATMLCSKQVHDFKNCVEKTKKKLPWPEAKG